MKTTFPHSVARVSLLGAFMMSMAVLSADTVQSSQTTQSPIDNSQPMKTVCAGRFLIDIPRDAAVSFGRTMVEGLNIVNLGIESEVRFNERLAQREAEINAGKTRSGMPNMESVHELRRDHVYGKIFEFDRLDSYYLSYGKKVPTSTVSVDGYASIGGTSFAVRANVYKSEDIGSVRKLIEKLQPMSEGAIPVQPGFCIDRGFIQDPLAVDQRESISMFVGLRNHDDLGIALTTMAGLEPGQGLLERNRENRSGPYSYLSLFLSTLLERQRIIHGITGDELAFKANETNQTTGYAFNWESQGTRDDVARPFVSLELQTGTSVRAGGEPVESSLSQTELLTLWSRTSSSLRLHRLDDVQVTRVSNHDLLVNRNRSLAQAQGLQ